MKISDIHESLVNGQRRQMVEQIQEYGPADFFAKYDQYLRDHFVARSALDYYTDATISYFRILER